MVEAAYLNVLRLILARLADAPVPWVVTGSLGMALQGMAVEVHDIDLQTNKEGAYEIERRLSEYVVQPVHYVTSERIRSHFGTLEIAGIKVEIMGAPQKRLDDHAWEPPVPVERYRQWVEVAGMRVPVLSLEYEYEAYRKLGRDEKAQVILKWLQQRRERGDT